MRVIFTNADHAPIDRGMELLLRQVCSMAGRHYYYIKNIRPEVSLTLASVEEITEVNQAHRGLNQPTDVLSFPSTRGVNPSQRPGVLPPTVNLGDMIICVDIAKEQAQEYGHSFTREMAFLAAHGMLHLLGFDHIQPADEQAMLAAQEDILYRLHISRALL